MQADRSKRGRPLVPHSCQLAGMNAHAFCEGLAKANRLGGLSVHPCTYFTKDKLSNIDSKWLVIRVRKLGSAMNLPLVVN